MRIEGKMHDKLNEMIREIRRRKQEAPDLSQVRAVFLGNFTLDLLLISFEHACYIEGLRPKLTSYGGEALLQEITETGKEMLQDSPDVVFLCLRREPLESREGNQDARIGSAGRKNFEVLRYTKSCIEGLRRHTTVPILIHNFEVPVLTTAGIRDQWRLDGAVNRVRRQNFDLIEVLRAYQGVHLIDIDLLQSRMGRYRFFDKSSWHRWRAPYTLEAAQEIARESMRAVRALKGRTRKCLVLDCDNTLWGGILGEVGPQGIRLGGDYPGSAFQEFQNSVFKLSKSGVVLALCSKNNEADVMEVLEKHPEMVLKKEHFVTVRINWQDKAANLREIGMELNLGLDSLVFVDDSEFETGLVDKLLPEVATILLPGDPAGFADALLAPGLFDTMDLSEEDRTRSHMYHAEELRRRTKEQGAYASLEDFYLELDMEAEVFGADALTIPRVAQLTQRSNQFNLTTLRYSETEIRELARHEDTEVRALRLRDRFGVLGIIGVCVLRFKKPDCVIEAFLMSCRALGRGVEKVLLKECAVMAGQRGCDRLLGRFVPTPKNIQVRDFYDSNRFDLLAENPDGSRKYARRLTKSTFEIPRYIKVTANHWDIGQPGAASDFADRNQSLTSA